MPDVWQTYFIGPSGTLFLLKNRSQKSPEAAEKMIEEISVRYLDGFREKDLVNPIMIEGLPRSGRWANLLPNT